MDRPILNLCLVCAALVASPASLLAGPCRQPGVASAPFIGAHDLRAIDHAAARLPHPRVGQVEVSVGSTLPPKVPTAPVPQPIAKVFPQYADYDALRTGRQLLIIDRTARTIAYVMPLFGGAQQNCP